MQDYGSVIAASLVPHGLRLLGAGPGNFVEPGAPLRLAWAFVCPAEALGDGGRCRASGSRVQARLGGRIDFGEVQAHSGQYRPERQVPSRFGRIPVSDPARFVFEEKALPARAVEPATTSRRFAELTSKHQNGVAAWPVLPGAHGAALSGSGHRAQAAAPSPCCVLLGLANIVGPRARRRRVFSARACCPPRARAGARPMRTPTPPHVTTLWLLGAIVLRAQMRRFGGEKQK